MLIYVSFATINVFSANNYHKYGNKNLKEHPYQYVSACSAYKIQSSSFSLETYFQIKTPVLHLRLLPRLYILTWAKKQ